MNKLKRALSIALGITLIAGLFGCSGAEDTNNLPALPEYASERELDVFAYNGPTDGVNYIDSSVKKYGDFRTVERYEEYRQAGFNTLLLSGTAAYDPESDWNEDNVTKKAFKNAYEAGIKKIIVEDKLIEETVLVNKLVGSSGAVYSETDSDNDGVSDQLVNAVCNELRTYCFENGFYGVKLGDKFDRTLIENYGLVYRALRIAAKRLYSEGVEAGKTTGLIENNGYMYILLNVAPIDADPERMGNYYALPYYDDFYEEYYYTTYLDTYTRYLESVIEACGGAYDQATGQGVDRISANVFLFKAGSITQGFYQGLQALSDFCKEKGVELTYTAQSSKIYNDKSLTYDLVSESEMTMELFTAMAFGARTIGYNAYMPSTNFVTTGIKVMDDGCFLSRQGEKNSVYYYGQSLLKDVRELYRVISNFDYQGSFMYVAEELNGADAIDPYLSTLADVNCPDGQTIVFNNDFDFTALNSFTADNDLLLITELKDSENNLYMYAVQNILDPRFSSDFNTVEKASLDFGSAYTHLAVFENGAWKTVKLNNGLYTVSLSAGYGVFVVPLKQV